MTRATAAALLLALAGCASGGGAGSRTEPASAAGEGRITVLVVNGTTDQLRITGRGASSVRLQPGQQACVTITPTSGQLRLSAEPLGGGENRVGTGGSGNTETGGTDTILSPSFSPTQSSAWEWKIGRTGLGGNELIPSERQCT